MNIEELKKKITSPEYKKDCRNISKFFNKFLKNRQIHKQDNLWDSDLTIFYPSHDH